MNRRREPISLRARKKTLKTIRVDLETEEAPPSSMRNLRGQNPAKPSRKKEIQKTSRLAAFKKELAIKKKKHLHPPSKRSTPGSVDKQPSAPAYPHKEGKRWIQTIEKQTLIKARGLSKKLSKKR